MTNQIYVKTFKRPYHKKLFKIENNEIYLFYSNWQDYNGKKVKKIFINIEN